ncbi:nucleotidyltransferase domain-containing protein [Gracilinema caldarium]|uniref:DNA polymerase beta domain protein region n=1 Tax=Gracilinema caldarium (strain ATCC 51460 / DSM 7334 / H1) TaxID=744872 RepID=F8EZR6_GRAC1|nr:nucleotidyltransferase domain-containing protein [Gracilinema caldarium]AEJ20790.1 DNA polymerase beta domain protein region [Gracilinema caldarium DSM 7334]
MSFGLRDSDLSYIKQTLRLFPEIKRACIFGSRAKGNYKPGSDIDIAVSGDTITFNTIAKLHSMLEDEGPMPYMIDVVDYDHLENQALKAHIDRVGQVIYEAD